MKLSLTSIDNASHAVEAMERKGVLPMWLGSKEAREQLAKALRDRAVWSARTTHAGYLQEVRKIANMVMQGRMNLATARLWLKRMLVSELLYTPEEGFPGDEALGIPPASPGSLQDLASQRRLDLVLRTQISLARNSARKLQGTTPLALKLAPAWELVRYKSRRVPRGSTKDAGIGWQRRWLTCGGPILPSGRLVAHKLDPVWAKLGDSSLHDDAMDVDVPPFAFNSGMGWREVMKAECVELGVDTERKDEGGSMKDDGEGVFPPLVARVERMDPDLRRKLAEAVGARESSGRLSTKELMARELARTRKEYEAKS